MEHILSIFAIIAEVISMTGITILVYGFTKELLKYIIAEFKDGFFATPVMDFQQIRCQMGAYILLALDFLIVSDIILSVVDLSREELLKLSITIILRIALGYFLSKEIAELKNK